jgi:adenylylsulfate kinase-like enzyme
VKEPGVVVWVTGPGEAMVERVAHAIHDRLARRHLEPELLTPQTPGIEALGGDDLARRVGFVADRLLRHGVVVVVAVPSPSRAERDQIRAALGRMIEVHVPVGSASGTYEPPFRPEVQIDFPESELDAAVERTLRTLELLGHVRPADDAAYSADEEREVIRRLKSFGYL